MTTSMGQLARQLAGGDELAIVKCSLGDSTVLDDRTTDRPRQDDLPIVEIPLSVIFERSDELDQALEHPIIASAQFVLVTPPFGRWYHSPSRHDISEFTTLVLADALVPEKRFAAVLMQRSIAGRRPTSFLSEVVDAHYPSTVIELSARELYEDIDLRLRVCAIVLDRTPPSHVILLSIPTEASVDSVLGEYETLLSEGGRTEHGFAIEGPIDPTAGFLPAQLDPERTRRIEEASIIGSLQRLGDLYDIALGRIPARVQRQDSSSGDIPVLSARMIQANGIERDHARSRVERTAGPLLQEGDIVIRSIGQHASPVVAATVHSRDLPLIADRSVLVLRPRIVIQAAEQRVFLRFIRSRRFSDQLPSHQVVVRHLTARVLSDVLIPIPDSDLLDAFATVESAADDLTAWRDEAATLLESSIDSDDLADARRNLISSSNLLRQRADAARLLDRLDHRVATRFPLPVAYRWRSALAARGSPDALRALLHAQEVLLTYLAITALTVARTAGVTLGSVNDIRHRFDERRGGITLGDWRAVLNEASEARLFQRLPENYPFIEVRDFFRDPDVRQASRRLTDLRNDVSHLREFSPGEVESILGDASKALECLFLAAEFITEYPLIRVLETRWDELEGKNEITYRHLAGDNPIVPREIRILQSNTIEADSLYIADAQDELHLLRPFLIGMECPACGHWSTFHPDRIKDDGRPEFKSLEHGHPNEMPESFRRALAAVGLLGSESA